jgi:hypothetical protein
VVAEFEPHGRAAGQEADDEADPGISR